MILPTRPRIDHFRSWFVALAAVILGLHSISPGEGLSAAEQVVIEAEEISGTTRAGSPVSYRVRLPRPIARGTPLALFDDEGRQVLAQFSPADEDQENSETEAAHWWIDFNAELKPWQVRRYTVRYGSDVKPLSLEAGGHRLNRTQAAYKIENAPYISWTVPNDLSGLLQSVDFPPSEHLRDDSPGLVLRDRAGREHVLGQGFHSGRVIREGRQGVALRFTGQTSDPALAGVRSTVDLIFPSPVSWVEVDWTIDDPQARVRDLGAVLNLALDPPGGDAPTLVDFGASSWIYAALYESDAAELVASSSAAGVDQHGLPWQVLRGPAGKLAAVAAGRQGADRFSVAEGWAHIMDRKRCLALAVDEFGARSRDRITAKHDGQVSMWREDEPAADGVLPTSRRLRFWLHFVFYPPQYSAATSPRMMQTPPLIRTIDP